MGDVFILITCDEWSSIRHTHHLCPPFAWTPHFKAEDILHTCLTQMIGSSRTSRPPANHNNVVNILHHYQRQSTNTRDAQAKYSSANLDHTKINL